LISQPVAIEFNGARLGAFTPLQLARALHISGETVTLNGEPLAKAVRPRLGKWIQRAHNAQFAVNGTHVRVVPSHPGKDVSETQLASAVVGATEGDHVAHVVLGARQPDLTTAKAHALGIKQKLVSYTTQMGESSSNRIHNVHLMADFIDGTVIQPGQNFSFND